MNQKWGLISFRAGIGEIRILKDSLQHKLRAKILTMERYGWIRRKLNNQKNKRITLKEEGSCTEKEKKGKSKEYYRKGNFFA